MHNIADYDDRITCYACVRPSTASVTRRTDRIMVEESPIRRISWQCKRSKWCILRAMHVCVGPNNPHSALQHAVAPHTYADVLIHRPVDA